MSTATAPSITAPPASKLSAVIDREELLRAVTLADSIIPARTPKPVLQCVRIEVAADNRITIAATNLSECITVQLEKVQTESTGVACVGCEKFKEIISHISDESIRISIIGEHLSISPVQGKAFGFKIYTGNANEFPVVPTSIDEGNGFEIGAATLADMIERTLPACPKEHRKDCVRGILFTAKENRILAVATDGLRLAICDGAASESTGDFSVIVGLDSLVRLKKLLDGIEGNVTVQADTGRVMFDAEGIVLVSNILEGHFPPYGDIVPKSPTKTATADRELFISAVEQARTMTTEESKSVRFSFDEKGVVISGEAVALGEAKIEFPCQFEGKDILIGLNAEYLIDGLRHSGSDTIKFEMDAPSRPVLITGDRFQYIQMPVNLAA